MTIRRFLFIKNLNIVNADAIATAYSCSLPSHCSYLKAMKDLEEKLKVLKTEYKDLEFKAIAVSYHKIDMRNQDYDYSFFRDLKKEEYDDEGKPRVFFKKPAPKCNLEVSFLIQYSCRALENCDITYSEAICDIHDVLFSQKFKICGGNVVNEKQRWLTECDITSHACRAVKDKFVTNHEKLKFELKKLKFELTSEKHNYELASENDLDLLIEYGFICVDSENKHVLIQCLMPGLVMLNANTTIDGGVLFFRHEQKSELTYETIEKKVAGICSFEMHFKSRETVRLGHIDKIMLYK